MSIEVNVAPTDEELLLRYETELKEIEARAAKLKKMISAFKGGTEIRWRAEIRRCLLKYTNYLATSNDIADCVANEKGLDKADRNIKVKISTSLSMMFKEKDADLGRTLSKDGEDFLYGLREFFEKDDRTILKSEFEYMRK